MRRGWVPLLMLVGNFTFGFNIRSLIEADLIGVLVALSIAVVCFNVAYVIGIHVPYQRRAEIT